MNHSEYRIGLGIFRVITCFLIVKNMCFYFPMADDLFGGQGIFPYASYMNLMAANHIRFLAFPFFLQFAPQLFLLLIIILSSAYLLGYGGRYVGFALVIALFILKFRNGFILDGSDNVMQVTLPFLVIADDHFFFRYAPKSTPPLKNHLPSFLNLIKSKIKDVALLGIMIQICFIYFFTSLAKLQGSLWLNGTAIYYTMRVREFMVTSWNIPLTRNHFFVVITTYATVIWEMAFPFLIWFKKTKYWIMIMGVMFHVGIWIFMRIDNFSWIMIGTYFVFISDREYILFRKWFREQKRQLLMLFQKRQVDRKIVVNAQANSNNLK